MTCCLRLVAAVLLACVSAPSAYAQNIRGVVLDDSTSEPIAGAEVILLDQADSVVAWNVTDAFGRFVLQVRLGEFSFKVLRMGYAPTITPPFPVQSDSVPVDVTIRLPFEPVVLDPVAVAGEAPPFAPGPLKGFYERKRRGWGLHLAREDIEAKRPTQFTDILRNLPGVRVIVLGGRQYGVRMVGAPMRLDPTAYESFARRVRRGADEGDVPGCPVSYYIDGTPFVPGEAGINEIFASEVEAIEVYRSASETPAEFLDSNSRCGVIVIWTKRAP